MDFDHRFQVGTGRPIQVLRNRGGEGGDRTHSIGGEGFWQQTHFREVKEARPPFVIDAEVARVHIGLGEDQSLMANLDGR